MNFSENFFNHGVEELVIGLIMLKQKILLWLLFGEVIFDYLTAMAKVKVWGVGDSGIGFKGLIKHVTVICLFIFLYPFAHVLQVTTIVDGLCALYCMNYFISILENFGVMGIWTPKFLKAKVEAEIQRYEKLLSDVNLSKGGKKDGNDSTSNN